MKCSQCGFLAMKNNHGDLLYVGEEERSKGVHAPIWSSQSKTENVLFSCYKNNSQFGPFEIERGRDMHSPRGGAGHPGVIHINHDIQCNDFIHFEGNKWPQDHQQALDRIVQGLAQEQEEARERERVESEIKKNFDTDERRHRESIKAQYGSAIMGGIIGAIFGGAIGYFIGLQHAQETKGKQEVQVQELKK